MKTKMLYVVALLLMGFVAEATPKIVEVHRSGGCFRRYWNVNQTYMGMLNGYHWWNLDCTGCGFERCQTYMMMSQVPGGGNEIDDKEELASNDVIDIVEGRIDGGAGTGSDNYHYQYQLSDQTTLDVYVTVSWEPDGAGGSNIHLEITHSNS